MHDACFDVVEHTDAEYTVQRVWTIRLIRSAETIPPTSREENFPMPLLSSGFSFRAESAHPRPHHRPGWPGERWIAPRMGFRAHPISFLLCFPSGDRPRAAAEAGDRCGRRNRAGPGGDRLFKDRCSPTLSLSRMRNCPIPGARTDVHSSNPRSRKPSRTNEGKSPDVENATPNISRNEFQSATAAPSNPTAIEFSAYRDAKTVRTRRRPEIAKTCPFEFSRMDIKTTAFGFWRVFGRFGNNCGKRQSGWQAAFRRAGRSGPAIRINTVNI